MSKAIKLATKATKETTIKKGAEEAMAIIIDNAREGSSTRATIIAKKEALKETIANDAKKPTKGDKKSNKGLKGKGKAATIKPMDLPKDVSNPSRSNSSSSSAKSNISKEVVSPRDRKGKSTKYLKKKEKERTTYKNKDYIIKAKSNKKGKAKAKINIDLSRFNPNDSN
ncbi:hypothetical protein N7451_001132 [Penicillium sp. IBT 35674x]|nr:hypothetical protein N7451_001132 [Penicillium sp. IBT 35674x]